MHVAPVCFGAALIAALVACSSAKEPAGGTGTASSAASGSAPAGGTDSAAGGSGSAGEVAAPLSPAVEAEARKVVDAWLAAQNGRDFAAYDALYADKLEGVKRVGGRTWRFDRKGWMADRQRMFKSAMQVEVKDVVVRGSPAVVTVELMQRFAQGKFQDEGPKQLVLVRGPKGLAIGREEMLRSDIAGRAPAGKAPAYVVIAIDKKPHVVIDAKADEAWGRGKLRGPFHDVHMLATRDASGAPAAAAWNSRALRVVGADGKTCDATVGALVLVAGGTPHFGEVQVWDGDPGMSDDGRKWTPAERAAAVFGMSSPVLVGELAVTGACAPIAAIDPAAKATVFELVPATTADGRALAAFKKLPAYADIQRDFKSNYDGKGDWAKAPEVRRFTAGDRSFLVVEATEGSGCGDFLGELSVIFEDKGGKLTALPGPEGFFHTDAILDADGDGNVELVGATRDFRMVRGYFVPVGGGYAPVLEVSFPFNDCGC